MLAETAVEPSTASPADFAAAHDQWQNYVEASVATEPLFRRREIALRGRKGHVLLTGTVSTFYEKQLAQEIVRRLEGVHQIDNCLEVSYDA